MNKEKIEKMQKISFCWIGFRTDDLELANEMFYQQATVNEETYDEDIYLLFFFYATGCKLKIDVKKTIR